MRVTAAHAHAGTRWPDPRWRTSRQTIADVKDWLPLLRFTQGNLTITVMVGRGSATGFHQRNRSKPT
jgi:hypothetical protein